MMTKTILVVLALAGTGALACDRGKGDDARSLLAAVDRFRDVDNAAKPGALPAIEAVACKEPEVCAAKDACLAFARPTVEGIKLLPQVQQGIDAVKNSDAAPGPNDQGRVDGLQEMLNRAKTSSEQGHQALAACDQQIQVLRSKYAR